MRTQSRTLSKSRSKTDRGTEQFTSGERSFEADLEFEADDQFQQAFSRLLRDLQKKRLKRDNSFSYEFPDVEQLRDFGAQREESWKRFSVTLDAGKSLYTFRVDTVDQAVKRLLSNRDSKPKSDAEGAEPRPEGVERRAPLRSPESTLEEPAAITQKEPQHTLIDALFYRITLNVEEGGYQGLLMVTLDVDAQQSYVLGPRLERSLPGRLVDPAGLSEEVKELTEELTRNRICPQISAFRQQFKELWARVDDFNLRLESTRINLPEDDFLADDLQDVEQTLAEKIRATHVEIVPDAEPAYEFREEKDDFGSEAKMLLDEGVQLDAIVSLPSSAVFTQNTDFNVWDVTDPQAMRGRPARRSVRLSARKTPQTQRADRLAKLREALQASAVPAGHEGLRPHRQRPHPAFDPAAFEQLHIKRVSFFNADFGLFFLKSGRIACPEPEAEKGKKVEEQAHYDDEEVGVDAEEAPPSKTAPGAGQGARKLRVDDLKTKLFEICAGSGKASRLSDVCNKLAEDEPESSALKHQSLFLILLHTASEKGLELANDEGDILITFPQA